MQDDKTNADPDHLDRLIREPEAADYLGYSVRALQNWRLRGGGPRFVRVSRRSIRYRRRDLNAWANGRMASSTADSEDEPHRGVKALRRDPRRSAWVEES